MNLLITKSKFLPFLNGPGLHSSKNLLMVINAMYSTVISANFLWKRLASLWLGPDLTIWWWYNGVYMWGASLNHSKSYSVKSVQLLLGVNGLSVMLLSWKRTSESKKIICIFSQTQRLGAQRETERYKSCVSGGFVWKSIEARNIKCVSTVGVMMKIQNVKWHGLSWELPQEISLSCAVYFCTKVGPFGISRVGISVTITG